MTAADIAAHAPPRPPGVTAVRVALALLTLVVVGLAIHVAGFPGPGPLRRYPRADLEALAAKIGPGCGTSGPAYVDWVASRVNLPSGNPDWNPLTEDEWAMIGHRKLVMCSRSGTLP